MRSRHELRVRIQNLDTLGDRLYGLDFYGRQWLASYAADAAIIADCMLELLDGGTLVNSGEAGSCDVCL